MSEEELGKKWKSTIVGKLIKVEIKEGVSKKGNNYKIFNGVVLTDEDKNRKFSAGFEDISKYENKYVEIEVESEKKKSSKGFMFTANTMLSIKEKGADGPMKVEEEFIEDELEEEDHKQTKLQTEKPKTEMIHKGEVSKPVMPLSSAEYWNRKEERDIEYLKRDKSKQVIIVRQNSYTQANELIRTIYDKVKDKTAKDMLELLETVAHRIEDDILRKGEKKVKIKVKPSEPEQEVSDADKIIDKLKENPDGITYDVLAELKISNLDKEIEQLISNGNVFEPKPGVYKLLE